MTKEAISAPYEWGTKINHMKIPEPAAFIKYIILLDHCIQMKPCVIKVTSTSIGVQILAYLW